MNIRVEQSTSINKIPNIIHGFFTRQGGISSGIYSSLNCSSKVGDLNKNVTRNRQLALSALKLDNVKLFVPNIVHGNEIINIDKSSCEYEISEISADGMFCDESYCALGVTYADCLPILLSCGDGSAVLAIHAGWRGIKNEIIIKAVARAKAHRQGIDWLAAIGPAISDQNFVVSGEVLDFFINRWPAYVCLRQNCGLVDLVGIACEQLKSAGITQIEKIGGFTDLDAEHYFSHRREFGQTGRHLALICKTKTY